MTRILLSLGLIVVSLVTMGTTEAAATQMAPPVHVSLVQAAGSDLKYERIDVTNDGETPADMTGWRLVYTTASGSTTTVLVRFQAESPFHLVLEPHGTESVVSKELAAVTAFDSPLRSAWQFPAGLSHASGSIQLLDSVGGLVDRVGWGASTSRALVQGEPAAAMSASTWLRRSAATMNNAADFILEAQTDAFPAQVGSLTEELDRCTNLDGLQLEVPEGYAAVDDGSCTPLDACPNLAGTQTDVPSGMEYDAAGACVFVDVCTNLEGVQAELPNGYEHTGTGVCEPTIPMRALRISELLPNPSGADAGNEFIELYNADTEPAELNNYLLVIGAKTYSFPAGVAIAPGEYWTASDAELGLALPNTTGLVVTLTTIRGAEVASVPAYKNAPDDASWALTAGGWQFSYAPTPGTANVALRELPCQDGYERDSETARCNRVSVSTVLAACAEGQYRSEATGRCRNLVVSATLVPCKEGQYRSEATGHCRSLASAASAVVKPCADDQFRNPLTNRCKTIASSDDPAVADCGEGRERNPATHRCRNVVSATVPAATFAVAPIKEAAKGFVGWWALGGVGVLAAGYGAWEWRREVTALIRRVGARLTRK